jgi:hypothetical protein
MFVCAASLTAMRCEEAVSPVDLLPAGDYLLTRATPTTTFAVPTPAPLQPGCGTLTAGRLIIAEDGTVRHTRTVTQVENGQEVSVEQELTPILRGWTGSNRIELDYRGWREVLQVQTEPTPADPDLTVLYVEQFFPGNAECAGRRLILRYAAEGVIG